MAPVPCLSRALISTGEIRPQRNSVNPTGRRIRRLVVSSLVRHLSLKVSGEEEYKVGAG